MQADNVQVFQRSRSQRVPQEVLVGHRSGVEHREGGERQGVVHEVDLLAEEHLGAVVALEEVRPGEEVAALEAAVGEVEATKMYYMVDKYWSCIHEAFRDTQEKREMGRSGSASSPGQCLEPTCTRLLEGESHEFQF